MFTETNNKKTSIQTRQKLILTGKKADQKKKRKTLKVNCSLIISAYICYLKKKCRAAKDNKRNKCTKRGKYFKAEKRDFVFYSFLLIDRLS